MRTTSNGLKVCEDMTEFQMAMTSAAWHAQALHRQGVGRISSVWGALGNLRLVDEKVTRNTLLIDRQLKELVRMLAFDEPDSPHFDVLITRGWSEYCSADHDSRAAA